MDEETMSIHDYERPLRLTGERVWRTWTGGRELDKLHGLAHPGDGHFPEEWMFSVTRANNVGREDVEEGLSYLADAGERTSLKQLVEAHPREMLGAAHAAAYGSDTGMLVKVLDSQVRLPIQVHPDNAAAMRLFGSRFGKTECWHMLGLRQDGDEAPCLYLGFKENVDPAAWKSCFDRQDAAGMLAMLNRIVPAPGETYIVHGGTPHAIGAGCLLVEIQEPTDLTIRLEKVMPYGVTLADAAMHQGLGFERMFECFTYAGKSEAEVRAQWRPPVRLIEETAAYRLENLVDYAVTPCFAMDRMTVSGTLAVRNEDRCSGLYVTGGSGRLEGSWGSLVLKPHDQVFLPAMCREANIVSTGGEPLRLLRFYGPKTA